MNNKLVSLILSGVISISMVGCNNKTTQEDVSGDDVFLECFEDAINERWTDGDIIEDKFEEGKLTEEEYYNEVIENIQEEINVIEESKFNIEDKELEKIVDDYIQGNKLQIECFKTENIELLSKYYEESNDLRKPALVSLVEDYCVEIDKEHQQTYKDFKEEATIINKEKDAQDFADKLASEMVFESSKNEWGDLEFIAIVENTSEINFASIQFQVNYKDADGIVIGNDYISLENFDANTKQKVTLTTYGIDNIEKIVVTTNYFEIK